MRSCSIWFRGLLSTSLVIVMCSILLAGGGPQNVLLVVNANSKDSLEIGNAYRRARAIPYDHVVTLSTTPDFLISYQTYLDEIETPIRSHLKNHQLLEQIHYIVLTIGLPQIVNIADGRATASLLASMDLPNRQPTMPMPNPYFNAPDAFSQRPANLKGMYLVTALHGYHTADIHRLINNAAIADGTAPGGRFLFQTNGAALQRIERIQNMLGVRNLKSEHLQAPPADTKGIMGFFSGGAQSGLTDNFITSCQFLPGAIADYSQQFGASSKNFDESTPPVFLPVSAFVRAGVSGVHGLVGGGDLRTIPIVTAPYTLLDKYTSGYSLAESFYAALPSLNGQNLLIGDPLAAPYARRPVLAVEMEAGPHKGVIPIRVTASSPVPDTTIRRVDAYLDDRFYQTIYEPAKTEITLYIGVEVITYHSPRGNTLRALLEGLADEVNKNPILSLEDGVRAVPSLATGRLQLIARKPGKESNEIPLGIEIRTLEEGQPSILAHLNGGWLEGGGTDPERASAVISFLGRRILPGDTINLQIDEQHLSYSVPEGGTLADIPAALEALVNADTVLKRNTGVEAIRAPSQMPYLTLRARRPGFNGNDLSFQVEVLPGDGSRLTVYPTHPSQLSGGHDGATSSQTIQFMLGEITTKSRFLIDTSNLPDGYHRLRFVATDGSLAQVQGWSEQSFITANATRPPLIRLPDVLPPVSHEAIIPVSAMANVSRVELYVDNKYLGSADAQPYNVKISLAGLGRGKHDLWAVGVDNENRRYITPPATLDVLTPPLIIRCTPNYSATTGGSKHRISGEGFLPDCTVKLAGVPVASVQYISPNLLEVVSDAGPARTGWVEVINRDGTVSLPNTSFEYYSPVVNSMRITPVLDVLAFRGKALFSAQSFDQHDFPMTAEISWKVTDAKAGVISRSGLFTAGDIAGRFTITAASNDIVVTTTVVVGIEEVPNDGVLRHWLLLGPIPDDGENALEIAHIAEGTLQPSRDDNTDLGLTWKSHYSDKPFIDLFAAFKPNHMVAAYAHLYLKAPDNTSCKLIYGSDDGIRIMLNGALINSLRVRRPAEPNQNQNTITLTPGWNRLLIKVDQGTGSWGFYMRIAPADDMPLPTLYYSIDRPVEE